MSDESIVMPDENMDTMIIHTRLSKVASTDRRLALVVVLLPFIGTLAAIALAFNGLPPTVTSIVLFAVLYSATMLGVECGYHRLFAHRSFKTTKVIEALLAIFGSMAFQGPLIWWAATHRRHHQYSDTEGDAHSPHLFSTNEKPNLWRGFIHSHMGWLFSQESTRPAKWASNVKDLYREQFMYSLHMNYYYWLLLGLILPAFIGGMVDGGWQGALLGFLWGGMVRIFFVHHLFWSLNSFCHLVGHSAFPGVNDRSRNVLFLVLPTFGQGWHNNHHAFPASAKCGLAWWQIDITWWVIKTLSVLGLAWDLRRVTPEQIEMRLRNPH